MTSYPPVPDIAAVFHREHAGLSCVFIYFAGILSVKIKVKRCSLKKTKVQMPQHIYAEVQERVFLREASGKRGRKRLREKRGAENHSASTWKDWAYIRAEIAQDKKFTNDSWEIRWDILYYNLYPYMYERRVLLRTDAMTVWRRYTWRRSENGKGAFLFPWSWRSALPLLLHRIRWLFSSLTGRLNSGSRRRTWRRRS